MELIQLNRNPKINEFSKEDLVLNTVTGDLFAKTNNKLLKLLVRDELSQTTTDIILQLIDSALDTQEEGGQSNTSKGFALKNDGFFSIQTSKPLTGSNVSLHGGIPFNYGQPLPNSPYIKTNGGFDILMDNANALSNSSFRIFRDTGIPGLGTELLKLDNSGNLTVNGSISGSTVSNTNINGGSF